MGTSIPQLIAAINPDLYYKTSEDKEEAKKELSDFKRLIKEQGIVEAAKKAKPKPYTEHKLLYESYADRLEPVYYFILDLMKDMGLKPQKLIDNFFSSPGSTHWQEVGQRKGIVQQQAFKIMGDINTILRSVLNIVYDLRDFKMRLKTYDDYHNSEGEDKKSALLALKQIWLDKVDIQKGNTSIKAMALGQAGFVTLLDAFMAADTLKQAEGLDLNERVKRILLPRIKEFQIWVEESEKELRKRFNIERNYLKSQVNSLKLYARWAKPYLVAASDLESENIDSKAALVKAFNRVMLEVTLFGKRPINPKEAALEGDLPLNFKNRKYKRAYNSCTLVDFTFTAVPAQGSFIGKVNVSFQSYALNDDELEKLKEAMDKSDLNDVLRLIQGATEDSLKNLEKDIEEFIGETEDEKSEQEKPKEEKKSSSNEDKNPFLALIGYYNSESSEKSEGFFKGFFSSKKKDKGYQGEIRPEDWAELKYLRVLAAEKAIDTTFNIFNIYKKAHGMASYI